MNSGPAADQAPEKGFPPVSRMRYWRSYQYVFESANWPLNVLLATVCQLIPVVGPLLVTGYQYEIIEALHRQPRRTYPDFDFNRFVDYLLRGLWPFLVSLIVGAVAAIPLGVVFFAAILLLAVLAAAVGEDGGVVFLLGAPVLLLLLIALSVALNLIVYPMLLRAGLAQDFLQAFNFTFLKRFLAAVWKEMIAATLFLLGTALVAMLLGTAALCIGMYPAVTLVLLAQAHLGFQLYQLYLQRGGEPIPLKEKTPLA